MPIGSVITYLVAMSLKKRLPFYIFNNSVKRLGVQYPEKISHQKTVKSTTSPE